ncbi:hypothetical protein HUU53_02315 [Candidatus Micrarchaeota archaeon]|nr:hypothetical protein [Candidatus Micrarchaeota archaeon]
MKIKILVDEKDEFQVLMQGSDLGFANYLVEKVLEDKDVSFAASDYDHPTSRNPVIKIKGSSPKKKLLDALKKAEDELKDLDKTLK